MNFLIGVLLGVLLLALILVLRYYKIDIRWYEWLIGGVGVLVFLFGWQNYIATRAEHWNPETSVTFFLVFGLPGILLMLLAIFLPGWRRFRTKAGG